MPGSDGKKPGAVSWIHRRAAKQADLLPERVQVTAVPWGKTILAVLKPGIELPKWQFLKILQKTIAYRGCATLFGAAKNAQGGVVLPVRGALSGAATPGGSAAGFGRFNFAYSVIFDQGLLMVEDLYAPRAGNLDFALSGAFTTVAAGWGPQRGKALPRQKPLSSSAARRAPPDGAAPPRSATTRWPEAPRRTAAAG